jgi:hypothetical protein
MTHPILQLLNDKGKQIKIALIGATNDSRKYGNIIYKDLKSKNLQVYGINPKATTIDGDKAYHSLKELDFRPDILNFVLPPKLGFEVVKEAVELGLDNFWFQPGAESEEILKYLEEHKKTSLAHACVMVATR